MVAGVCAHACTCRNCTWDADSSIYLLHQQLWTTGWEGMQPEQLTRTDQRDIPCHVMSCSAIKPRGSLPGLLRDWLSIVWLVVNESFCIPCFVLLIFVSCTYETVFISHTHNGKLWEISAQMGVIFWDLRISISQLASL